MRHVRPAEEETEAILYGAPCRTSCYFVFITATIESDLNNAALKIPQIHWSKPAGDGGDIGLTLLVEKITFMVVT